MLQKGTGFAGCLLLGGFSFPGVNLWGITQYSSNLGLDLLGLEVFGWASW